MAWNSRKIQESGFSADYEDLLKTYANDYNKVNHRLVAGTEINMFFKDGFSRVTFSNGQQFDFEGLKGRLLASSYTPMPGEPNYEPMMVELKKLFDKYEVHGKVSFEYETKAYIGEV